MNHKNLLIIAAILTVSCQDAVPLYKQADAPIEKRVEDLLSRMTLEEKILQMNQVTLGTNLNQNNIGGEQVEPVLGSYITYTATDPTEINQMQKRAMEETRLGIPVLFGFDAIHGFRTVYPIPLAQSCSWNPELVEKACSICARESRLSGIPWTFSPMVDIARDGRWGRCAEGYGEDPYTASVFCAASVRGYQGDDISDSTKIAACIKHYIGYGASEAGRDYVPTEISSQTLWDTYMPPYQAGIEAGAATVMSSFNTINGTPASASPYHLTQVLKEQFGWDGMIVSDWDAVKQLVYQGAAADHKESAWRAVNAGLDMDMADLCYFNHLEQLVKEGKVGEKTIDESVRRILRLKFRLGLFENPYPPVTTAEERFNLPGDFEVVEQLAEESSVLLKNNGLLPLGSKPGKIALIGPMVDNYWDLIGSWGGHPLAEDIITIKQAFSDEFGPANVLYAKGCDFEGDDRSGYAEAVAKARQADVVVLCLGEKSSWSGENGIRSTLALPSVQEQLAFELKKTGKPMVLLLNNGRPLELCRLEPLADAILELWQPGIAGGKPAAGILSGRVNPSGKLSITFPYATGQVPIYYNRRRTSRPFMGFYQDITSDPMYEFAYGLSYSTFEYGDIREVCERPLTFEISVTNTSSLDGLETVHWFICDPVSTVTRPYKELKFFEKKLIRAGKTEQFRFEVDPLRDFGYVDESGRRYLEKGKYQILVKDKLFEVEL
ncbi:MAG: glycoside hydrolase family 3 C-terminal domain-containing protein [Rikenellaceae bacterium]|nr:glycoside hydrolase family 3 C-terminal domain-containing protein [Rikenellaceae bacterium]